MGPKAKETFDNGVCLDQFYKKISLHTQKCTFGQTFGKILKQ
jgi:hypothetical protein